jgi:fatty-acyl-CoA synthase
MEAYRIQLMIGVTTIMKMMLDVPDLLSYNLEAWKYAILPGSPLPFSLIKEAYDRIGVLCQNLWGMTELCGPGSFMNVEDILNKPGSAGKPYFNVDLRIVDADGTDLPAGQVGEVVVSAPHAMLGYWNRPDATRETIQHGWLYTGDLGYVDAEGFLYVIDRKKDMLVSGGENVYPAEIERVITELPEVAEVSVIGIPDEKWGEVPKAFIVTVRDRALTTEAVIAFCRSKLAGYKVPKQIAFIDQLPRTPSGKVLKRKLRTS